MKNLLTFGISQTPSQSTVTWGQPAQQSSTINGANPLYPRVVVLTDLGVRVQRGTTAACVQMSDLIAALVTLEPTLSWPPVITVQPVAASVTHPAGASFAVTATCEACLTLSYQWQHSTDGGATWSNLTNAGVYSNVTTATMSISDSTGLDGNLFRCNVTNASGTTATSPAKLTVL